MARRVLIILLILLVLLVAVPLGMGMAMGACPDSHDALCPFTFGACATIVTLFMVFWLIASVGIAAQRNDRPPART